MSITDKKNPDKKNPFVKRKRITKYTIWASNCKILLMQDLNLFLFHLVYSNFLSLIMKNTLESVPRNNQYYTMRVKFLAQ